MTTQSGGVDRAVLDKIDSLKPKYIPMATFCSYVLDQYANAELAENLTLHHIPPLQSPQTYLQEENKNKIEVVERDREGLKSGCETGTLKGRERERTTDKKKTAKKPRFVFQVPDDLQFCSKELEDFWKEKKGAKSERAGAFLFEQIRKMQSLYGEAVVIEQLLNGTAHRWESITVVNYERYGLPVGSAAMSTEKENKHPSRCVFTAANGFEND